MRFCERFYPVTSAEGTIHFAYDLSPPERLPVVPAEVSAWRSILFRLGLIGQHPERYDGYAYGNLSLREDDQLFITASQTSGATKLERSHWIAVNDVNIERFWVEASGFEPPSSETLTHAMIYASDARTRCVLHIHNPEIWLARSELKLPETDAAIEYGTPAMAQAVAELLTTYQSRPLVFATAGHEDGIFALGQNLRDVGGLLISYYSRALALAHG